MNNFITKVAVIFCGILFLSGCATYKFQHGNPPYDKGYVAARDDKVLLEYTLGKDKSVPGIKLAKERFDRRKRIVEHYYKKMGVIQNHFTMAVWEPTITFWKMVGGVFRMPLIIISDFRYEHNPKYKERIRKLEDERDLKESVRIKKLKDKLDGYIEKDIAREIPVEVQQDEEKIVQSVAEKITEEKAKEQAQPQEAAASVTAPVTPVETKEETKEEVIEEQTVSAPAVAPEEKAKEELVEKKTEQVEQAETSEQKIAQLEEKVLSEKAKEELPAAEQIVEPQKEAAQKEAATVIPVDNGVKAVIIAKPIKGYSPLRAKFNGLKSSSKQGRVVSYFWDFGDGETSTRPNPVNLYWSTTYGSRYYTATLTVKDDKGNSAVTTATIEVLTK